LERHRLEDSVGAAEGHQQQQPVCDRGHVRVQRLDRRELLRRDELAEPGPALERYVVEDPGEPELRNAGRRPDRCRSDHEL